MSIQKNIFGTRYLVGAYERLSKEDDRQDDSSSIASQRMIIESFAKFNNLQIVKHYVDDGFTGSNFNRPGFEKMKKDIEDGLINCVLVKDLSRLGREMYETGTYIEEYFLSKHVRFIAINDGYDSDVGDSMLGIRLSVNDMYLRDTSKKIRSSFDVKRSNGDYIGSYAVFGYMKKPDNPKVLIPDPAVADVVVQIFEWLATGIGTSTIAHRLTKNKIPIPSIYKKENRTSSQKDLNQGNGIWRPQTVKNIGENMMYLGHMVQGRWKKVSYNSKKLIELPKSQWIIVENTHQPLVSQKLYDQVQVQLAKTKKFTAKGENTYLLQGLLRCKECGHNISISKKKKKVGYYLSAECNYYSKYSKYGLCTSHRINYKYLEEDILHYLKEIGKLFLSCYDNTRILEESGKIRHSNVIRYEDKLKDIQMEISKNHSIIERLYDDRLHDIISSKQYTIMAKKYDTILDELEKEQKSVEEKIKQSKISKTYHENNNCEQLLKEYMSFEKPDKDLMYQLINKIEVDKDKNVEVFFKVDLTNFMNKVVA